jgi:hypothetical protein
MAAKIVIINWVHMEVLRPAGRGLA